MTFMSFRNDIHVFLHLAQELHACSNTRSQLGHGLAHCTHDRAGMVGAGAPGFAGAYGISRGPDPGRHGSGRRPT